MIHHLGARTQLLLQFSIAVIEFCTKETFKAQNSDNSKIQNSEY